MIYYGDIMTIPHCPHWIYIWSMCIYIFFILWTVTDRTLGTLTQVFLVIDVASTCRILAGMFLRTARSRLISVDGAA